MDWFPLYNSLRIALVSSIFVFFTGIFAAYYIAKLHIRLLSLQLRRSAPENRWTGFSG